MSWAAGTKSLEITRDGKKIAGVSVELAETPEEREKGLMFRKHLPETSGMYFIFERDTRHPFWMENTYVSLDMIFINKDGRVADIIKRTKPLSRDPLYPTALYRYVLEVPAGFADKFGVQRGDVIRSK